MDTIRNVTQLQIGKAQTETGLTEGAAITVAALKDGEVIISTPTNLCVDGTVAHLLVKFIQRSGDLLLHSDLIDLKNGIRNYSIGGAVAEVQQLDYVGWNGVSGALDGLASNIYTIRLNCLDKTTAGFMQQKIKEGFYKSNANAASYTQWVVAEGLVNSLIANYSRETEQDITFGVTNGGARTASTVLSGSMTFVKGSVTISAETAIDGDGMAVGDLIAITNALTEETYRIVSLDTTAETAVIDHAYQGATVTVADPTWTFVPAATAQAAGYGVKLQGVDREFKAGFYWSNVNFWDTQIDFGDLSVVSLVTKAFTANPGQGTGDYIANLELELQSDEYVYSRPFPEAGVVNRADAVPGNTAQYDTMVIEHKHTLTAAQGTPTESPKALMIAWAVTGAQADSVVDNWEDLLDLVGTVYTSQKGNLT
jgi:hypothetical protein